MICVAGMASEVCQYSYLYRLLRDQENPRDIGITAEAPDAKVSVHDHVRFGSNFCSQYISTSATWHAILIFASKKKSYPQRIAKINVAALEDEEVSFIDLTDEENREDLLEDERANNFARKFQEVLIEGAIPPECIDNIFIKTGPMEDFESEAESEADSDYDFDISFD